MSRKKEHPYVYVSDLLGMLHDASYSGEFKEGSVLILRDDIYSDIGGHIMDCEAFNKFCAGLKLKDFRTEHADIDEPYLILHKDSLEYKYLRPVLAL